MSAIYRTAVIALLLSIATATVCYSADIAADPDMSALPEGHNEMLTANAVAAQTIDDNDRALIIRIPLPAEEVLVICAILGLAIVGVTAVRLLRRGNAAGRTNTAKSREPEALGKTDEGTERICVRTHDTGAAALRSDIVLTQDAAATATETSANKPEIEPKNDLPIGGGSAKTATRIQVQSQPRAPEDIAVEEPATAGETAAAADTAATNRPQTESPASASDRELASRLEEYVAQHMHNVDLSVDDIAAAMCMSRSTLFRRMKQIYNMNPNEYLRQRRLSYAAELLQQNKYSISDVCLLVGFNSPSYFSSCFKKQYNVLPKDYRVR